MAKLTYDDLTADQKKDVISSLVETAKILTILDKDIVKSDKNNYWKKLEEIQDNFACPETRTNKEFDFNFEETLDKFITTFDYSKYYKKQER